MPRRTPVDPRCFPSRWSARWSATPADPREPPRTPEGTPGRTPRLPVKTVCGQLQNEECKKTPGCIKVKGQGCKGTYENGADCEAIPKKKWCRKAGCARGRTRTGPTAKPSQRSSGAGRRAVQRDVRERGRLRSHPK